MKSLIIEKALVKENLQSIKEAAGTIIIADLSGNAHGLGLMQTAEILRNDGIRNFAVSEVADAQVLRSNGFVEEQIIMLRSTSDRSELETLIDLNIVCTIGSSEAGVALNGIAKERNTVVEAQLKIDTGFGYYGFMPSEKDKILSVYKYMSNIVVVGLIAKIASGKTGDEQIAAFKGVSDMIESEGYKPGTLYAVDSEAGLAYTKDELDAICVGAAITGSSFNKQLKLKKIGYIEAEIEEKGWFQSGNKVGEQGRAIKKPMQVALLSIGWYNGIGLSRMSTGFKTKLKTILKKVKREVYIGEKKASVIYVGKNYMLIDVTNLECSVGDKVRVDADPIYVKRISLMYR